MKRSNIAWEMLLTIIILGGISIGSAFADEILQPNEAYTIQDGNHLAVIYYTPVAHGYEVVTSWVVAGSTGALARNSTYLKPGQHYTLSLQPAGVAASLEVQGHADSVAMKIKRSLQVACVDQGIAKSQSASEDQHSHRATTRSIAIPVIVSGSLITLDHHLDKVSLLSGR